jgi:hypothetical protein
VGADVEGSGDVTCGCVGDLDWAKDWEQLRMGVGWCGDETVMRMGKSDCGGMVSGAALCDEGCECVGRCG